MLWDNPEVYISSYLLIINRKLLVTSSELRSPLKEYQRKVTPWLPGKVQDGIILEKMNCFIAISINEKDLNISL